MKFGRDMVIVCATDFSDSSKAALDAALGLARSVGGAEVRLLYVDEAMAHVAVAPESGFATEFARLQEEGRALTESTAAEARTASGLQVTAVFRTGNAYAEVARYATEAGADVIVVGSHGRTGLTRMLMGSVAERIVRNATCSVLVVKHEATAAAT